MCAGIAPPPLRGEDRIKNRVNPVWTSFVYGKLNGDTLCFQEGGDAGSLVGASIAWQTQNEDAMEVEDRGAANYNAQVLLTGFKQLYRVT